MKAAAEPVAHSVAQLGVTACFRPTMYSQLVPVGETQFQAKRLGTLEMRELFLTVTATFHDVTTTAKQKEFRFSHECMRWHMWRAMCNVCATAPQFSF